MTKTFFQIVLSEVMKNVKKMGSVNVKTDKNKKLVAISFYKK